MMPKMALLRQHMPHMWRQFMLVWRQHGWHGSRELWGSIIRSSQLVARHWGSSIMSAVFAKDQVKWLFHTERKHIYTKNKTDGKQQNLTPLCQVAVYDACLPKQPT